MSGFSNAPHITEPCVGMLVAHCDTPHQYEWIAHIDSLGAGYDEMGRRVCKQCELSDRLLAPSSVWIGRRYIKMCPRIQQFCTQNGLASPTYFVVDVTQKYVVYCTTTREILAMMLERFKSEFSPLDPIDLPSTWKPVAGGQCRVTGYEDAVYLIQCVIGDFAWVKRQDTLTCGFLVANNNLRQVQP